jgi:hypothetical protein
MKNINSYRNLLAVALVVAVFAMGTRAVSADGGYGHTPVDTAIAGITDQASVLIGIGSYIAGSIFLGVSKILRELIA